MECFLADLRVELRELSEAAVAAVVDPAVPALVEQRIGTVVEQLVHERGGTGEASEWVESPRIDAYEVDVGERASHVAALIARLGAEQDQLFVPDDRDGCGVRRVDREAMRALHLLNDPLRAGDVLVERRRSGWPLARVCAP